MMCFEIGTSVALTTRARHVARTPGVRARLLSAMRKLVARLTKEALEEEKREQEAAPTEKVGRVTTRGIKQWLWSWRSWVLRVMWAVKAAIVGMVMTLLEKRVEMVTMNREILMSQQTGEKPTKNKQPKKTIMSGGVGKELGRSQSSTATKNANDCKHTSLKARGNAHTLWWTCVDCGQRWERTDDAMYQKEAATRLSPTDVLQKMADSQTCPSCSRQMELRMDKAGKIFWGCLGFPRLCRAILMTGTNLKHTGELDPDPDLGYEVLMYSDDEQTALMQP